MLQIVTRTPFLIAALIIFVASSTLAEDDVRTVPVHFKAGSNSATVKGKVKGYDSVDYVLEASKGQHMSVSMETDNASSYFNILEPGENEAAMFIGSTSGNEYKGKLPKSGKYKIRIYLMRNAARRDEVAKYTLKMKVTGDAEKAGASSNKPEHKHVGLGDLKGMDAITAIDVMTSRGFKSVDSITSGETLYGIYYNPSTKQCIQLTNADDRVYAVSDIKTHPKCH